MYSCHVALSWIGDLTVFIKTTIRLGLFRISCPRPAAKLLPEASPHRLGVFRKVMEHQFAEAVENHLLFFQSSICE